MGRVSSGKEEKLEWLINQYPDVLNEKLGLTHIMEYEIQLLDYTPVRLTPYRLSPPKMQYFREHIKALLRDGVIEPNFQIIRVLFLSAQTGRGLSDGSGI